MLHGSRDSNVEISFSMFFSSISFPSGHGERIMKFEIPDYKHYRVLVAHESEKEFCLLLMGFLDDPSTYVQICDRSIPTVFLKLVSSDEILIKPGSRNKSVKR